MAENMIVECRYSKEIEDMHRILLGNGNPENGMCVQIVKMGNRIDNIDTRLEGIYNSKIAKQEKQFKVMLVILSVLLTGIVTSLAGILL